MADKAGMIVLLQAVVDPTLGRVFTDVQGKVASLRRESAALAKYHDEASRSTLRLSLAAKGMQWKADGFDRMGKSLELGKAAVGDMAKLWEGLAEPVKISADYQAIVNDLAPLAGKGTAEEKQKFGEELAAVAHGNGIDRDELATATGKLAAGGAKGGQVLEEAKLMAMFSVGQGVAAGDTATLMNALRKNSGSKDGGMAPGDMKSALSMVAQLSGGEFGAEDMAKQLPALLMEMKKLGITGQEAVVKSVALLNEQAKTAATPADAAKNAKDLLAKLGSGEANTSAALPPAPSAVLARNLLNKLPGQEVTPDAERLQNDQRDKRGQSKNLWGDLDRSVNEAKRSVGDAIQPASDMAAQGLTALTDAAGAFAKSSPTAVAGIVGVVGALNAFRLGEAGAGMARGAGEFGIGTLLGKLKLPQGAADALAAATGGEEQGKEVDAAAGGVQQVSVVNWPGDAIIAGGAVSERDEPGKKGKKKSGAKSGQGAIDGQAGAAAGPAGSGTGGVPTTSPRARAGMWDRLRQAPKVLGRLGRRSLGSLGAAYEAYEVLQGAGTVGEKVRGLGRVGAGLAGGAAGAKAGALIGAFGGPIGIAVGGLVGGGIGAALGAEGIDGLGKAWAERRRAKAEDRAAPPADTAAQGGAGRRSPRARRSRQARVPQPEPVAVPEPGARPRQGRGGLAVSAAAGLAVSAVGAVLNAGLRASSRMEPLSTQLAAGVSAAPWPSQTLRRLPRRPVSTSVPPSPSRCRGMRKTRAVLLKSCCRICSACWGSSRRSASAAACSIYPRFRKAI